jgi:hypothetical protein
MVNFLEKRGREGGVQERVFPKRAKENDQFSNIMHASIYE